MSEYICKNEKDVLEELIEFEKRQSQIPESEQVILDSPKFTKHAIGVGDDGKPFTDEEVERNNEILYGKDEEEE